MAYNVIENFGVPIQSSDYVGDGFTGTLQWWGGRAFSADIYVPLFIKDHPYIMRKPKYTEVNTITQLTTTGTQDTSFHGLFQLPSDPLQVTITGWIISPMSGGQYATKLNDGTVIATAYPTLANRSYAEIVQALLQGEVTGQRKDPDAYSTPHGFTYRNPIILSWDFGVSSNARKITFTMTLLLER